MKKIFFMHIPKCGGSSLISSFNKYYPKNRIFRLDAPASTIASKSVGYDGMIQDFRLGLLMYSFYCRRFDFISGHFFFNDQVYNEFSNDWDFITIVREPVSRFLSHYFFSRFQEVDHHRIYDDLDVFISKPSAKSYGDIMLKYFSGSKKNISIDRAKTNIDKFKLIGDLDSYSSFTHKLSEIIGFPLAIEHTNINPVKKPEQIQYLSNNIMDKIHNLCRPDIELYKYLKNSYDL